MSHVELRWNRVSAAALCVGLAVTGCGGDAPTISDAGTTRPDAFYGPRRDATFPDAPGPDVDRPDVASQDADTGAPACPGARVKCGEDCVDTQTNSAHCGQCGSECDLTTSCQAGRCEPIGTEPGRPWAECTRRDCVDNIACVPDFTTGRSICSAVCSDGETCPDGSRCVDVGGGNSPTCFDLCEGGAACPVTTHCQTPIEAFPGATATTPRLCAPPR